MIRYAFCLAAIALSSLSYAQDASSSELESGGLNLAFMPTMPESVRIQSDYGAEYNHETGLVTYKRGVQMYANNGVQLFANQAVVDTKKELIYLTGDVSIYQGAVLHKGEKAVFNYKTKELDTNGLRSSLAPLLLDSDTFETKVVNGKRLFVGENAGITTHDRQNPDFWIRAEKINVYPGEKVVFRDLKLYAGERPVFWLPYLAQPLDKQLGYHFVPGSRSNWGVFLLNSYGTMLGGETDPVTGDKTDQWLLADWKFDLRSKRGVAVGVDLIDTRLSDNSNLGWLSLYFANDQDPELSRSGLSRGSVSKDRYKVELKHRWSFQHDAEREWRLDSNLTFLSDQYYLEDFEPRVYNTYSQPENIVGLQLRDSEYQLGAYTRFQLNDFYLSDTRFPELYFDQVKRPVLDSGLLHESSSSFGLYREELGDGDARAFRDELLASPSAGRRGELERLLLDNRFTRLHTYHEISYPLSVADGFAVTPRAGAGYSHYWSDGVDGGDHGSAHFYLGLDAAMKFTKTYGSVQSERWGLNQLRHVIQPYANLSVLSTDELDASKSKIDYLTATERPRTFDVARYSAIDDYRNWSIARLGVRNQLLTKRDGRSHSWLTMDTYLDSFLNDPEFDRQFSNLYNEVVWDPVPWGSFTLNTQFPISAEGFTEVSTRAQFLPCEDLEIEFGHSYLADHPIIQDSNLIHGRVNLRLSDRWGVGAYQQWQFQDGVLERQEYTLNRNFESWSLGAGIFQRDNRLKKEYGLLLNISLNAVPSATLPFNLGTQ